MQVGASFFEDLFTFLSAPQPEASKLTAFCQKTELLPLDSMADARTLKAIGTGIEKGFAEGPNKFKIQTSGHDVTQIQIAFEGPSQPKATLVTNKDKTVDVTYTTQVPGDYKIHIKYSDKNIPGSPFKCTILGDIKASISKVKLGGPGLTGAKSNVTNEIVVDSTEAGFSGGLSAHIEGPSKPELSFRDEKDGKVAVLFKPTASGAYKIHLKYGQYHIPGSPATINVA